MAQERFSQTMTLPSYAANPVSDRAGLISNDVSQLAGTLGFVSEITGEAMKYSATSEIEQSIKKNVEDYQKQSPTYLAQTSLDVKTMQDKLNDPSLKESEIPGIVKSINDKVNFLQTARDQRKINDYEFTSRINQVTREALAKNPGFSREILSKAQQTLDLNNIQQTIKMDTALFEAERKSIEQQKRDLIEVGKQYHIIPTNHTDPETGDINWSSFTREVNKYAQLDTQTKQQELVLASGKQITAKELQYEVNSGRHLDTVTLKTSQAHAKLSMIASDPTDLTTKLAAIDKVARDLKLEYATQYKRILNEPPIKMAYDMLATNIDNIVTQLKESKDGTQMRKILDNESKINEFLGDKELDRLGFTPARRKMLSIIGPYVKSFGVDNKLNEAFLNVTNFAIKDIANKMKTPEGASAREKGFVDERFKPGTVKLPNGEFTSLEGAELSVSADNIKKGDLSMLPNLKEKIDNYITYINFDSDYLSTKDRTDQQKKQFLSMDEMFKQIGNPKFKEVTKYLDQYQLSEAAKGLDNYNRVIYNNFMKYRTENPNEKVRISQNWDGTLLATGGSEEFNNKFIGRINTGLKAYSNLVGKSPNEVSNEFYSRYYQDIFTKNVNELSMKVKPVEEGNIDLKNRPVVKNTDGTISTVRSMSFRMGNTEILVPTVSDDGKILTENEAIKRYLDTGKHLGKFRTAEEATTFAKQLHNEQDKMYSPGNTLNNFASTPGGSANKKADLINTAFVPKIISTANAGEVDQIVTRLIDKESKGLHTNPTTRQLVESPKGAKGITQVMPTTGVDPGYGVRPLQNNSEAEYKRFGRDYFVAMLREFNGDAAKALAAYNWGPDKVKSTVKKHGEAWFTKLPTETKDYVASIL
jgi:hypothetical protein